VILEAHSGPMLYGFRAWSAFNLETLCHTGCRRSIKTIGGFVLTYPEISVIDMNPVGACTNGASILDALVAGS
jgi:hypothetical protein